MAQASESILIVEDESSIASFVALYLKNAGYGVRTVGKGTDALDQIFCDRPFSSISRNRPRAVRVA